MKQKVVQIQTTDGDDHSQGPTFAITSGNSQNLFEIDPLTGKSAQYAPLPFQLSLTLFLSISLAHSFFFFVSLLFSLYLSFFLSF